MKIAERTPATGAFKNTKPIDRVVLFLQKE
jgi:hypothetical protein